MNLKFFSVPVLVGMAMNSKNKRKPRKLEGQQAELALQETDGEDERHGALSPVKFHQQPPFPTMKTSRIS